MDSNNKYQKVPQTEILFRCNVKKLDILSYDEIAECTNTLPFDKEHGNQHTIDNILNYLESCVYCDALLPLLSHYEYLTIDIINELKQINQKTSVNGYFNNSTSLTSSSDERPARLPSRSLYGFRLFSASRCFYHHQFSRFRIYCEYHT